MDEASWAAVEIFGAVTGGTINACDVATVSCSEVATDIPVVTAITFDGAGDLWSTRNAFPGGPAAEVIQVP